MYSLVQTKIKGNGWFLAAAPLPALIRVRLNPGRLVKAAEKPAFPAPVR